MPRYQGVSAQTKQGSGIMQITSKPLVLKRIIIRIKYGMTAAMAGAERDKKIADENLQD